MRGTTGTVRLGIAGCGALSVGIHLPNSLNIAGLRVTAIADPDPAALRRAQHWVPDARAVSDWTELMEGDDVDAVLVALPTAFHAEAAVAVMRAGRHLYLEKPVATSLDSARSVQDAARDSDVIAMIGFNYRFNRLFAQLRAIAGDGTIGRLIAVRSCFSTCGQSVGWRADTGGGGGVLLDLASHHADLIPYITGRRVVAVGATVGSVTHEGDTAAVTLELEDGVIAQSLFTAAGPEQDTVELIGESGSATVRRYESLAVEVRGRNAAGARRDQLRNVLRSARAAPYLRAKRRAPGNEPSYLAALRRFVESMRTGSAASPGIEDGIEALAVIEAAGLAAAGGMVVRTQRHAATDSRNTAPLPAQ
jgi:predicted dehydrogenase